MRIGQLGAAAARLVRQSTNLDATDALHCLLAGFAVRLRTIPLIDNPEKLIDRRSHGPYRVLRRNKSGNVLATLLSDLWLDKNSNLVTETEFADEYIEMYS